MDRMMRWSLFALGCAALGGCETMKDTADSVGTAVSSGWDSLFGSGGATAAAELKPTQGNTVAGKVEFKQSGTQVRVKVDLTGLAPGSEHGFHVHERGDCSAPDAMSAGGHFNPSGNPHAHFSQSKRHAGDLANLKAGTDGVAHYSFESELLSVGSGSGDVIGHSVVVHRDPDDYQTQPAGNSGPRLACGVITAG
jgi:Cu-Zn family superoxide dismutase